MPEGGWGGRVLVVVALRPQTQPHADSSSVQLGPRVAWQRSPSKRQPHVQFSLKNCSLGPHTYASTQFTQK
jgi:hypothetical protein